MTTIIEGIGMIMILIGGAAADSESLLVPVVLIGAGAALMLIGKIEERRIN